MSLDRCTTAQQKSVRDITMRAECNREEFISPIIAPGDQFPSTFSSPSTSPFHCPPPPPPPPSVSSSSTLGFDLNCPIISHWPRRGSGSVSSTGVDVYIYTLYGARFQPTAVTHKAEKRSHFLAPLRKQRKDHGSNRVVQSGSWTLNHNKHFFLTAPCSENREWRAVGCPAGVELEVNLSGLQAERWVWPKSLSALTIFCDGGESLKTSLCLPLFCFLQENTDTKFTFCQQHPDNLHKEAFPKAEEELVEWAKQKFGGITSFTTVQNPQMLNWTSSSGENWTSTDLATCSSLYIYTHEPVKGERRTLIFFFLLQNKCSIDPFLTSLVCFESLKTGGLYKKPHPRIMLLFFVSVYWLSGIVAR